MKIDSTAAEWRNVEGEIVGVDLRRQEYFALNPSAAALWSLLAEGTDEPALVAELRRAFGLDEQRAQQDVRAFVGVLRERDLLLEDGASGASGS